MLGPIAERQTERNDGLISPDSALAGFSPTNGVMV